MMGRAFQQERRREPCALEGVGEVASDRCPGLASTSSVEVTEMPPCSLVVDLTFSLLSS